MRENAFELAIAMMGIISGAMAVMMASAFSAPMEATLYSADAATRTGIAETAFCFFLGAAALSAGFLFLRRPVKTA